MSIEETEQVATTAEPLTSGESQSYSDVLEGEGSTPQDGSVSESGEKVSQPLEGQESSATNQNDLADQMVALEIGGKTFTGPQGLFQRALDLVLTLGDEGINALSGAEKIAELKRNYDKGFTQKSQAIAEERKSFETAFGRMPDAAELTNLGKLYQLYFQNPSVRQTVDAILSGQTDVVQDDIPGNPTDPVVHKLMSKINSLEQQISGFQNSFQAERDASLRSESKKIWNSWVEDKQSQGLKITEELEGAMGPFIQALFAKYPDWEPKKVLDEPYRHATIDDQTKKIAAKVIQDADKAKKANPPKMTPKIPSKTDAEKSYAEILEEG